MHFDSFSSAGDGKSVIEREMVSKSDADIGLDADGWHKHARHRCSGFARDSSRPGYHQVINVQEHVQNFKKALVRRYVSSNLHLL